MNIFEKDYLVCPVNEDYHWYLAIVVNPSACICGSTLNTSEQTSYVVILDSLLEPERHRFTVANLWEYLRLEYANKKESKNLPGTNLKKDKLKLLLPKSVPQQKNEIDCGLFLLHFAELFLTAPPQVKNKSYIVYF